MKGKYIQGRPSKGKDKGGNPSYYKPDQEPSPCISSKTGVMPTQRRYFNKETGKFRKSHADGSRYISRTYGQVIKTLDGRTIDACISLLKHPDGTTEWLGREIESQWDNDSNCYAEVLIGENMHVERMSGITIGWVELTYVDRGLEPDLSEGSTLSKLAGVLK